MLSFEYYVILMECAKYATALHGKKGQKYEWKQFVQSFVSFLFLDIIFFSANNFEAQFFYGHQEHSSSFLCVVFFFHTCLMQLA